MRWLFVLTLFYPLMLARVAFADIRYTVTDLGGFGGSGGSIALSINSSGQVAGAAAPPNSDYHPFFYDGMVHDIGGVAGDSIGLAVGINDSGNIAGYSRETDTSTDRAFYYDGTMHQLGPVDGASRALGINNAGQVAGYFTAADQSRHIFMYDGVFHDLGTMGSSDAGPLVAIGPTGEIVGTRYSASGSESFIYDGTVHVLPQVAAEAVNASGIVVGVIPSVGGIPNVGRAFYYDGSIHTIGTLAGFTTSDAHGINDLGAIVGELFPPDPASSLSHAFIYSDGALADLNTLIDPSSGWLLDRAFAINDGGQIVGDGYNPSGAPTAFLLTPTDTPEPSNLLSVVAAFCLLARWTRKRPMRPSFACLI